jgi:hypothetical protein
MLTEWIMRLQELSPFPFQYERNFPNKRPSLATNPRTLNPSILGHFCHPVTGNPILCKNWGSCGLMILTAWYYDSVFIMMFSYSQGLLWSKYQINHSINTSIHHIVKVISMSYQYWVISIISAEIICVNKKSC